MAFTSIEIIALVLLIFAVIKMIVLLINPQSWLNFAGGLWKNKVVTKLVVLILAAVVFYYLIQELTIVQIFAVTAFTALLLAIGLSDPIKRIIPIYEKQIKQRTFWKDNWLYTLIWLVLMVWVFLELFF